MAEEKGADRVSERASEETKGAESAVQQEVNQERQSPGRNGEREREQNKTDTNQLESQGRLPSLSISDQNSGERKESSTSTDSEKKSPDTKDRASAQPKADASQNEGLSNQQQSPSAQHSEADKMLRGFAVTSADKSNGNPEARDKVADAPVHPFTLSSDEYKAMLRAGSPKGVEQVCSTLPQSPKLSKQEIQNTCGIDLKSKLPDVQSGIVQVYGEGGIGTGFLACDKGNCQIVTDEHVVGAGNQVTIVKDGKAAPGVVSGRDSANDLASISVDAKRLPGLKPLPLGSGSELAAGTPVFAVGHGKHLAEQSVSPGQITTPSLDVRTRDGDLYHNQFDSNMKTVPGHSGSPVLDRDGKVVAVIGSSGRSGSSGPKVETVKELLRRKP